MIIDIDNKRILTQDDVRSVNGIDEKVINRVKDYLQGAVYSWCKNVKANGENKWFATRDFLGGANCNLDNTPMMDLYEHYKKNSDSDYAHYEAGKAAGRILKQLLLDEKRTFETRKNFTREYRWNGEYVL